MHTFTVRDLREHTGELIRGAENGELSVITKHGTPVFIAGLGGLGGGGVGLVLGVALLGVGLLGGSLGRLGLGGRGEGVAVGLEEGVDLLALDAGHEVAVGLDGVAGREQV